MLSYDEEIETYSIDDDYDDDVKELDKNETTDGDLNDIMDSVLKITNSTQTTQDQIRNELMNYLDQIDKKVGSDGELLVKFPSNFNMIAESMNRNDLMEEENSSKEITNGEKPWSQYLLLDSLTREQNDTEYQGRYKYAFQGETSFSNDSDKKIKKGLAQIQLLDRQLNEVVKRNTLIESKASNTTRRPQYNNLHTSSLHSMNKSNNHNNEYHGLDDDLTFLTATKKSGKYSTPRGEVPAVVSDGMNNHSSTEDYDTAFKDNYQLTAIDDINSDDMKLSIDQNTRLEMLLQDNDDNDHLEQYIDEETRNANKEIDEKLAKYGRIHRLTTTVIDNKNLQQDDQETLQTDDIKNTKKNLKENRNTVLVAAAAGVGVDNVVRTDYLKEQRLHRQEKKYAEKIDKLLEVCKKTPLKFDIVEVSSQRDSSEYNHSTSSSRYCNNSNDIVPVFSQALEHKYSYQEGKATHHIITSKEIKVLVNHILETNSLIESDIDKDKIQKLLSQHQSDLHKLQVTKILAMDNNISSTIGNKNSSNNLKEEEASSTSSKMMLKAAYGYDYHDVITEQQQQQQYQKAMNEINPSDHLIKDKDSSNSYHGKVFDLYEAVPPSMINIKHPAVFNTMEDNKPQQQQDSILPSYHSQQIKNSKKKLSPKIKTSSHLQPSINRKNTAVGDSSYSSLPHNVLYQKQQQQQHQTRMMMSNNDAIEMDTIVEMDFSSYGNKPHVNTMTAGSDKVGTHHVINNIDSSSSDNTMMSNTKQPIVSTIANNSSNIKKSIRFNSSETVMKQQMIRNSNPITTCDSNSIIAATVLGSEPNNCLHVSIDDDVDSNNITTIFRSSTSHHLQHHHYNQQQPSMMVQNKKIKQREQQVTNILNNTITSTGNIVSKEHIEKTVSNSMYI